MSAAPSMPLFCGDYLADTMTLSMEESGAYLQILMVTWRNGGKPLPDDNTMLARICRMTASRFRDRIRPAIAGFFDLSAGTWRNLRLEREWDYVAKRAEVSRANGQKGGRNPNQNARDSHGENGPGNSGNPEAFGGDKPLKPNGSHNPAGSFQGTPDQTQEQSTQPQPQPLASNRSDSRGVDSSPARDPAPEPQQTDIEEFIEQTKAPEVASPRSVKRATRATRWPEGMAVPAEWIAEGYKIRENAGLPWVNLTVEAEIFVRYWTSANAKNPAKKDWPGTWRIWVLKTFSGGQHVNGRTDQSEAHLVARRAGITDVVLNAVARERTRPH